jgi:gliding motility-associated-like protein
MGSKMITCFTDKVSFPSFGKFKFLLLLLCFHCFSETSAQCNNISAVSFNPVDTLQCGLPATVNFLSNVSVDSTPVLLTTATSSPSFQSFFSHNFPTANNGCFYYLEVSGMFTVWQNTPSYFDGYGNFNVVTNQLFSQGIINNFSISQPLFLSPNSYNPNHIYQYYYLGDGSTINVSFTDNLYIDNSGSMTFSWYAVPCFSYQWDFGDSTTSSELNPTHTYSNSGAYQVTLTVTDLYNNCSDSFNTTITINPAPIVDLGGDTIICNNEALILDATTPNANYEWQNGTNNPTLNATQNGWYWVDVTVQGCTTRDSIEVTVLNSIVNDISTTICQGEVVTIGNNSYDSSGFYTNILTSNQGCDSIVNLDLTVIIIDAIINTPLALDCNNLSIELDGNGSATGLNISYLWLTQDGNIINGETTLNPEIDGPGLYQLIVTYNDGTLICAETDTVFVFENMNLPTADAGINQTLNCSATTLTLDGSNSSSGAEFTYQWSTDIGNIVSGLNTLTPQIDQQGNYTLVVTNEENGCTASDSAMIDDKIIDIENFNIIFESPTCFGNDGFIAIESLIGNDPFLYSIDGGETYFPNPVFDFLSAGDYTISIKDTFGCEVSEAFFLPVPLELDVQLVSEATIQFGQSFDLHAEINLPLDSIFSINWLPATDLSCDQCLDPIASPVGTTIYTVTVIDNFGCQAQAQVEITVKTSRRVYIPNAFSPLNRDGNNDVFKIYTPAEQVKQVNNFKIFNRWGSLVYEAIDFPPNDPLIGWDGTFQGKMLQSGVFVYYIEIEFIDGKVINYKGDVSITN